jgi:hypothetical protein
MGEANARGRDTSTPAASLFLGNVVLCVRSKHFPTHLCAFTSLVRFGNLDAQRL